MLLALHQAAEISAEPIHQVFMETSFFLLSGPAEGSLECRLGGSPPPVGCATLRFPLGWSPPPLARATFRFFVGLEPVIPQSE